METFIVNQTCLFKRNAVPFKSIGSSWTAADSTTERKNDWKFVTFCLTLKVQERVPTTPAAFQTTLCINWAREARFGIILYVSGFGLRSVIHLSDDDYQRVPPVTCHLSIIVQACRAHTKHGSKSAAGPYVDGLSAAEMRLSELATQSPWLTVSEKWCRLLGFKGRNLPPIGRQKSTLGSCKELASSQYPLIFVLNNLISASVAADCQDKSIR